MIFEQQIAQTLFRVRVDASQAANADLILSSEAPGIEPGRVAQKNQNGQVIGRTIAWIDGYNGENVTLERAFTRGLEALEASGKKQISISPLSSAENTFPDEPAALILLNTVVRELRENAGTFDTLDFILRTDQDSQVYQTALAELTQTMMGT